MASSCKVDGEKRTRRFKTEARRKWYASYRCKRMSKRFGY